MIRVLYSLVAIVIVAGVLSGCKTPSILVTEEQRLGDRYNNEYAYEQAIVHYKGSLQASLKLGVYRNMDMEADICRKISHAYSVLGKYDPAEEYILKALIRDSAQENSVEIIEDYRELGKIYLYRGEFGEGIDYLNLALDLNEGMESSIKGTNQRSVADTYLTLSQLYTVLGDFKQGELYGLSALRIFRSPRCSRAAVS